MDPIVAQPPSVFDSELDDSDIFPFAVLAGWDERRHIIFHAVRDGRLRELTVGHGHHSSDAPWLQVTSYEPTSDKNDRERAVNRVADVLAGVRNDYEVAGLSLGTEPTTVLQSVTLDGAPVDICRIETVGSLRSAACMSSAGRAFILAWHEPFATATAHLVLTTDLGVVAS